MRFHAVFYVFLSLGLIVPSRIHAQAEKMPASSEARGTAIMPGMSMSGMSMSDVIDGDDGKGMPSTIELKQSHETSGTGTEPASTPAPMLMASFGSWSFMFHGQAFLSDIQESGPRGAGKLFSTNWIMPMAQRQLFRGTLTLRAMFSFEPATVSRRFYPELFQQGETAYGKPIVDGQHPHDFPMEVAAIYDYQPTEDTLLSFYGAPVGDPALGPVAYPHRTSASENPIAALGHHLEDSTHISSDVITAGITYHRIKLEASGFHGREPDEFRWDIDSGTMDSWSTRLTVNPAPDWSGQFSIAHLQSPEALFPSENIRRITASVMYNLPLKNGNWASTLLWGRNQSLLDGNIGNGYLAESTLRFNRNSWWTRIENVDRTNELLLSGNSIPSGFAEKYFARIQGYTAGYDREIGNLQHLSTAIGGQLTWYGVPSILQPLYGQRPVAGVIFLRLRPR